MQKKKNLARRSFVYRISRETNDQKAQVKANHLSVNEKTKPYKKTPSRWRLPSTITLRNSCQTQLGCACSGSGSCCAVFCSCCRSVLAAVLFLVLLLTTSSCPSCMSQRKHKHVCGLCDVRVWCVWCMHVEK